MDDKKEKDSPSQLPPGGSTLHQLLIFNLATTVELGKLSASLHWRELVLQHYGTRFLKGRAEFEVKIVKKGWGVENFGVTQCKKVYRFNHLPSHSVKKCVWENQYIFNSLVTPRKASDYGQFINICCEGDRIGLCLPEDGALELFVNGKSQGRLQ